MPKDTRNELLNLIKKVQEEHTVFVSACKAENGLVYWYGVAMGGNCIIVLDDKVIFSSKDAERVLDEFYSLCGLNNDEDIEYIEDANQRNHTGCPMNDSEMLADVQSVVFGPDSSTENIAFSGSTIDDISGIF